MKVYIIIYIMPYEGYSIDSVYDSMDKAQKKIDELRFNTDYSNYGEWEIYTYDVL